MSDDDDDNDDDDDGSTALCWVLVPELLSALILILVDVSASDANIDFDVDVSTWDAACGAGPTIHSRYGWLWFLELRSLDFWYGIDENNAGIIRSTVINLSAGFNIGVDADLHVDIVVDIVVDIDVDWCVIIFGGARTPNTIISYCLVPWYSCDAWCINDWCCCWCYCWWLMLLMMVLMVSSDFFPMPVDDKIEPFPWTPVTIQGKLITRTSGNPVVNNI
jgi:hypothetical protein